MSEKRIYNAALRCCILDAKGDEYGALLISRYRERAERGENLPKISSLYGGYFRRTPEMDGDEEAREKAYEELVDPMLDVISRQAMDELEVEGRERDNDDVSVYLQAHLKHMDRSKLAAGDVEDFTALFPDGHYYMDEGEARNLLVLRV